MSKLFEEMAQGTAEAFAYMEGEWLATRPKPTVELLAKSCGLSGDSGGSEIVLVRRGLGMRCNPICSTF
jgi:hypothetical protein